MRNFLKTILTSVLLMLSISLQASTNINITISDAIGIHILEYNIINTSDYAIITDLPIGVYIITITDIETIRHEKLIVY